MLALLLIILALVCIYVIKTKDIHTNKTKDIMLSLSEEQRNKLSNLSEEERNQLLNLDEKERNRLLNLSEEEINKLFKFLDNIKKSKLNFKELEKEQLLKYLDDIDNLLEEASMNGTRAVRLIGLCFESKENFDYFKSECNKKGYDVTRINYSEVHVSFPIIKE